MLHRTLLLIIFAFIVSSFGASPALTGSITNSEGVGIKDVKVSLVGFEDMETTTDSLGNYDLPHKTTALAPHLSHRTQSFSLQNNRISFATVTNQSVQVTLLDLHGRVVASLYNGHLSAQSLQLSLSGISNGIYILQIVEGNRNSAFKQSVVQGRLSGLAIQSQNFKTEVKTTTRSRSFSALMDTLLVEKQGYNSIKVPLFSLTDTIYATLHNDMKIIQSMPINGDPSYHLADTIQISFNSTIALESFGQFQIKDRDGHVAFTIASGDVTITNNRLVLARSSYYVRGGQSAPINLNFSTDYSLWSDRAITVDGDVFAGKLIDFSTMPLPIADTTLKEESTFNDTLNFNSLSEYQRDQLANGKVIHSYSGVTNRSLTGAGVRIALEDIGVLKGSEVFDAVVYASVYDVDKLLLEVDSTTWYNHGTQMARYMLDYAPGISILDFNTTFLADYIPYPTTPVIQQEIEQNIDILSLSGSGIDRNHIDTLIKAINNGLVFCKSLGNNDGNLNDTTQYANERVFIPYYKGLNTATGAMVTLQAAIEWGTDTYRTIRTHAGHARHYTLTILETGNGATSQATATFSAMVALMMEANNKYNAGYTNRELVEILFQTATDIGDVGVDNLYGHGLVNLESALAFVETKVKPTFTLYENLDSGVKEVIVDNLSKGIYSVEK